MIFLFRLLFGKEVFQMAVVYATLIIKGKKTIGNVPARIREQVKQILIDLDCAELIED
nr:CD1375 family protein [uncultured Ruminococcus sp.]